MQDASTQPNPETKGKRRKKKQYHLTRRKARNTALQALYEIDCTSHPVDAVVASRIRVGKLDEANTAFMSELVHGVLENLDQLDASIGEYAPEWPVPQMSIIDRNILRMAIYELTIGKQVPVRVTINEAIELAKLFGSDNAPRFINGVLGTVAETLPNSANGEVS